MTRKGKMILILMLFLVSIVITILRESGYLHLRLYRSYVKSDFSIQWTYNLGIVDISREMMPKDSCPVYSRLKDIPLAVWCLGYKYGESEKDGCYPVAIFIDHIDHGPLWIPLYKNVAFECEIYFSRGMNTYRQKGDSMQLNFYMIDGVITVNGNLTITGVCSYLDAERILAEHLMVTVYKGVRDKMDKQQ